MPECILGCSRSRFVPVEDIIDESFLSPEEADVLDDEANEDLDRGVSRADSVLLDDDMDGDLYAIRPDIGHSLVLAGRADVRWTAAVRTADARDFVVRDLRQRDGQATTPSDAGLFDFVGVDFVTSRRPLFNFASRMRLPSALFEHDDNSVIPTYIVLNMMLPSSADEHAPTINMVLYFRVTVETAKAAAALEEEAGGGEAADVSGAIRSLYRWCEGVPQDHTLAGMLKAVGLCLNMDEVHDIPPLVEFLSGNEMNLRHDGDVDGKFSTSFRSGGYLEVDFDLTRNLSQDGLQSIQWGVKFSEELECSVAFILEVRTKNVHSLAHTLTHFSLNVTANKA